MATRNVAPVNDNEGNIGTSTKKWAKGWFYDLYVGQNITDGTNTISSTNLITRAESLYG